MTTLFYNILFYIYWAIALCMCITLVLILFRERDRGVQLSAALLVVPVVLRILFIK